MQRANKNIDDHRKAVDEIKLLKDKADACARAPDVTIDLAMTLYTYAIDLDQAARVGIAGDKAGNVPQQGRFARARRAHDRNKLAFFYFKRNILQNNGAIRINFCYFLKFNH